MLSNAALALAITLIMCPLARSAQDAPAENGALRESAVARQPEAPSQDEIIAIKREIEALLKRRLEKDHTPGHRITPPLREDWLPATSEQQRLIDQVRAMYDRMMSGGIQEKEPSTPLPPPTVLPARETWTMFWDDAVDGHVPDREKSCEIDLRIRNGVVAGAFVGTVMGDERDAAFSGEMIELGAARLFTMRQDEQGYAVAYAGRLDSQGHVQGTWYDTRGCRGDFVMWHDGNRPVHGVNRKTEVMRLGAE